MKQYWKNIYIWPKGKYLDGTGSFNFLGYVDNFWWREDPGYTYMHLGWSFYYRKKGRI